jgi:hypothetical protein
MGKYGRVRVLDGIVEYLPGSVDAAVPRGPWSFAIQGVERITERTFPVGPVFDWFLSFAVKGQEFALPTEAFEDEGLENVLNGIGAELGVRLQLGLANRTDLAEHEVFRRV